MRKVFTIVFIYVTTICSTIAHSGRTDRHGGHNDRIHGGYHYHHGYPEHQHKNYYCPYDNHYHDDDGMMLVEAQMREYQKQLEYEDREFWRKAKEWSWLVIAGGIFGAAIWGHILYVRDIKKAQDK